MEDHTYNHLHIRGIVPEDRDGPTTSIIPTIGGDGFILVSTNTIVHTITLGPQVILTPSNGLPNHTTNLCGGHIRGGGL
jgi:hypothetical protein